MNIEELNIPEPCCESWREMSGDDVRRHCDVCEKDVVNLSGMTEEETRQFLVQTARPCVRFVYDDQGKVVFMHPQVRRQRRGVKRLVGAAALVVPLFFAGCDSDVDADPVQAEAVSAATEVAADEVDDPIVEVSGVAELAIDMSHEGVEHAEERAKGAAAVYFAEDQVRVAVDSGHDDADAQTSGSEENVRGIEPREFGAYREDRYHEVAGGLKLDIDAFE